MQERNEITSTLVGLDRTVKVVSGGRTFKFRAVVVVGDKNGRIGIGKGKATEVIDATEKAKKDAMKNMVKISLREGRTIHHDAKVKSGSGFVLMRSAPAGTGIIAGGPIRALCEAGGVKDIVVKSLGSSNPLNMLKAAMKAFKSIKSPKFYAEQRGLKVSDLVNRRQKNLNKVQEEK